MIIRNRYIDILLLSQFLRSNGSHYRSNISGKVPSFALVYYTVFVLIAFFVSLVVSQHQSSHGSAVHCICIYLPSPAYLVLVSSYLYRSFLLVLGPINHRVDLPLRPTFLWDSRDCPWTDGKCDQETYVESFGRWCHYNDVLAVKNPHCIVPDVCRLAIQSKLNDSAINLCNSISDGIISSTTRVDSDEVTGVLDTSKLMAEWQQKRKQSIC